jgi:ribonucleoside-diphosphate reductase alpha chain
MRQHYLDPKNPTKPTQLAEVNKHFEEMAKRDGFYTEELIQFLAEGGHLADREEVPDEVKRVFVTAHEISPEWHVRMQAAFQRGTDNAVSKTINFANEATVEDVETAYLLAYREGCKGITIYRDGSRELQVLSHTKKAEEVQPVPAAVAAEPWKPRRQRLPDERMSITHKFQVGEQEGYVTVGLYEDGRPGEVFLRVSKQGSTVNGLMESLGQLTSIALQYGVPLDGLATKMKNTRFEPSGMTGNREIPTATSLVDYVFRWLERRFVHPDMFGHAMDGLLAKGVQQPMLGGYGNASPPAANGNGYANGNGNGNGYGAAALKDTVAVESGVGCPECGGLLHYAEGCMTCRACGYTKCG